MSMSNVYSNSSNSRCLWESGRADDDDDDDDQYYQTHTWRTAASRLALNNQFCREREHESNANANAADDDHEDEDYYYRKFNGSSIMPLKLLEMSSQKGSSDHEYYYNYVVQQQQQKQKQKQRQSSSSGSHDSHEYDSKKWHNNNNYKTCLPQAEMLPRNEVLGGYIFVCNNETMQEDLHRQLFGLPQKYKDSVRAITPGLPLFLYNYTAHQLHGVFQAVSFGGSNIDPTAWEDKKCKGQSRFPAQVRIRIKEKCKPLQEDAFRPILHHYDGPKFRLQLSVPEALALLDLFKEENL